MPKYLIHASYTEEGLKAVMKSGGSARRDAVAKGIAASGGSLELFYFGFGADDAYVVADFPDNVTAAALALQVGASGMATTRTVVLLTPEDIDKACAAPKTYIPPGS